jgi:hypothetical protein
MIIWQWHSVSCLCCVCLKLDRSIGAIRTRSPTVVPDPRADASVYRNRAHP